MPAFGFALCKIHTGEMERKPKLADVTKVEKIANSS